MRPSRKANTGDQLFSMQDASGFRVQGGQMSPTFLGVGPPKCATTWLDSVLRQHPEILLPSSQKEVFFFDNYYDRGETWYRNLFKGAEAYLAAGEISTSYIASDQTLERIQKFNPDIKIIVMLRNPVNRMVSNYRMFVENGRTVLPFEEALADQPAIVAYSRYREMLDRIDKFFPRSNVFIGIYEEIFQSPDQMSSFLADLLVFLSVDASNPEKYLHARPVRSTKGAPRSLWLVRKAKRIRSQLKRMNLEWLVKILERLGVSRELFLKEAEAPVVSNELRDRLMAEFENDISAVEAFLGRPVPSWRSGTAKN